MGFATPLLVVMVNPDHPPAAAFADVAKYLCGAAGA